MVTFDSTLPGTSTGEWDAWPGFASASPVNLNAVTRCTVVAAHPDDETLGAGGLIAELGELGVPVTVIVVTDGSASNPESSTTPAELALIRGRELRDALAQLDSEVELIELGFPDGKADDNRDAIAARIADAVPAGSTVVAPWRGDGHRDHRIIGEICAELAVANGATLLEYPIWMWHWAHPDDPVLPVETIQSLALSAEAADAKQRAISLHVSQTRGLGPGEGDEPVLSAEFLEHFESGREVFFVSEPAEPAGIEPEAGLSKQETYFDELYARTPDPWRLSTRWYETRKRAITVASLPRQKYESVLEIGCSVGELTALLAERADDLLALDISQAAVDTATARTSDLPNVRIEHRDATIDFPDARFDLVVLSEVGYYWDAATLTSTVKQIVAHLTEDGTILACHWRHPVDDYPLLGDWVHAVLREVSGLHRVALHEEEDFILEVFARNPDSVAEREGFLS